MPRLDVEKEYWDSAAADANVRDNFIIDKNVLTEDCINAILDVSIPEVYKFPTVVEIGSGIGRLTEIMADKFNTSAVIGMDVSSSMVELAQEQSTHDNCHYYESDGKTIYVGDDCAQLVYSMVTFQHTTYENILSYFKEAFRALQPKGVFRFQFIQGDENEPFSKHYQLNRIVNDLESIGFSISKIDDGLICKEWTWVTAVK